MNSYNNNNKRFPFIPFIINISIPLVFGATSRYLAKNSISDWFLYAKKPWFAPPLDLSVAILILLYILIGTASFKIWRRRKNIKNYKAVICLYFSQLFLHATWRVLYFNERDFTISLTLMAAVLCVVFINLILFYRISKLAGILLFPFFIWLIYISLVTYQIFQLN